MNSVANRDPDNYNMLPRGKEHVYDGTKAEGGILERFGYAIPGYWSKEGTTRTPGHWKGRGRPDQVLFINGAATFFLLTSSQDLISQRPGPGSSGWAARRAYAVFSTYNSSSVSLLIFGPHTLNGGARRHTTSLLAWLGCPGTSRSTRRSSNLRGRTLLRLNTTPKISCSSMACISSCNCHQARHNIRHPG